jgi:hypothetical protein
VVDNSAEQSGGGIQNTFGTVVARNSVISRNHAANGGGYSGFGFSGIAGSGDLTILDSSITDNSAEPFFGGAGGIATGGGTSVIRNSVIRGNRAGHGGGIVYGGGGPDVTLTIRHSAISDNSADHDAGGIFIESGFITFNDSKITRNVAGDLGGGILATNENEGGETSVTLNDTSVSDNKTVGTNLPLEAGGGIYSHNAGLHLNRSRVYSNSTTGANSVAGGIFAEFGSSLTLRDSSVSNNSSKQPPGGIYVKDSTVALTDSRVINNRPTNCSGSPIPVPGCVD